MASNAIRRIDMDGTGSGVWRVESGEWRVERVWRRKFENNVGSSYIGRITLKNATQKNSFACITTKNKK